MTSTRAFDLNHQSLPDYVAGGLQLQIWDYECDLDHRRFPNSGVLNQADEVVRWTQMMELDDGLLKFEVIGGSSSTWGGFGGQGYLRTSTQTNLSNLNAYTPDVTTKQSGAGYAANRVKLLVLKRVRLITSEGEVFEDTTARVVHQKD